MRPVASILNLAFSFVVLSSLVVSSTARADIETFVTKISIKADWVDGKAERNKHLCYRLAAQGKFVRDEQEASPWYSADKVRIWRVTEFSTGLKCREMIVGGHDRQFGDGAKKMGCQCEGNLEITK